MLTQFYALLQYMYDNSRIKAKNIYQTEFWLKIASYLAVMVIMGISSAQLNYTAQEPLSTMSA